MSYAVGAGEELVDVWGVATTPSGDVLVWDAGPTHILKLSGDLEPIAVCGREGTGPGEFVYQRTQHGDWLAVGDSSFVVLGLGVGILGEFTFEGTFVGSPTRMPPFPVPVLRLQVTADDRIVYGMDAVDSKNGTRALNTFRLEKEGPHTLLRSDPMPTLPLWQGRPVHRLPRQGRPLWAANERCAYISDGSGAWLLRTELATGMADTLWLPALSPPEPSASDLRQWEKEWESARLFGMAPPGVEKTLPTAEARWRNIMVDPDGHVWIEPWRPPSQKDDPLTALVLNPLSGAIDSVSVPRFPTAFLPNGHTCRHERQAPATF